MGHDDYSKRRGQGHHNDRGNYREEQGDYHGHRSDLEQFRRIFEKVKGNKTLLLALAVIAMIGIVLVVGAAILSLPLLTKGFATVQKSGIKGLLEMATPFLEQFWSGTGK